MGLWAFYFLGKAYLHYRGYINFSFWPNLLLAVFLAVPMPAKLRQSRIPGGLRVVIALTAGFLILWGETWFPPIMRTLSLLAGTGGISIAYVVRFIHTSVSIVQVVLLAAIFAVCYYLNKRITMTPLAFAAILAMAVLDAHVGPSNMNSYLESFYNKESKRVVSFDKPAPESPDFDIIVLHICSMSWDDLSAVGLDNDPFMQGFDLVFTDFNSVSSYTNPSAIRLLRANCGQERHGALYREADRNCYLLDGLRAQGYESFAAIDNDAPSYRFVEDIMNYGHADRPIEIADLPIRQYDFDKSPIYDDLAILNRWWQQRQASGAEKAVLYMDITTMHGGAHWADDPKWWTRKPAELYREFGVRLFANLGSFMSTLERSGRKVVVVFVPEHGMALRGSSIQSPDIREIPLPSITTVPVGIRLIGGGPPSGTGSQIRVSKPVSYTAIAYLLKSFLGAPEFGREHMLTQSVIDDIPETPFVAENEANMVVKKDGAAYYYGKDKKWTTLPEAALR